MISSNTPYKLAEIIRDTWPQLYLLNKNQNDKKDMKFTVYSKDGCPYCVKVQQVLTMAIMLFIKWDKTLPENNLLLSLVKDQLSPRLY